MIYWNEVLRMAVLPGKACAALSGSAGRFPRCCGVGNQIKKRCISILISLTGRHRAWLVKYRCWAAGSVAVIL